MPVARCFGSKEGRSRMAKKKAVKKKVGRKKTKKKVVRTSKSKSKILRKRKRKGAELQPADSSPQPAVRLNLGSGATPLPGYENLDIKQGQPAYPLIQHSVGSVDEVRASHILEHYPEAEAVKVVDEWARVLKVGGILKIAVPDFEWVVKQYGEPVDDKRHALLRAFVMGGQTDEYDHHRSTWTRAKLTMLMESAGLREITDWKSEIEDCASLDVSLNLQGVKREKAVLPEVKVSAVMSVPRLCFTTNMGCAMMAFAPMGIPLLTHQGAFWGQTLTQVLLKALKAEAEYIFTLDYDTVFSRADVEYMLMTIATHPDMDALAGMQIRRGKPAHLFTLRDADNVFRETVRTEELETELIKTASAHFGLTVLRASKLAALPHPWFISRPDPQGKWDDGKLDEDMHFWEIWREAGNSLFVTNRVRLGHIEEYVAWPGGDWRAIAQSVRDYHELGMPEEAKWPV